MGLSIAGIILVQIIWINNAIGVKNDLFDRSVNEALGQAVQRLEDQRNFRIFTRVDDKDSLIWVQQGAPVPPPRQRRLISDRNFPGNFEFKLQTDSSGIQTHTYTFPRDSGKPVHAKTIVIRDTAITVGSRFFNSGFRKLDSMQQVLDTMKFLSPGLHKRIEMKAQNLQNFRYRVIREIAETEHDKMPLPEIAAIVRRELSDKDIPIPFDLAVSRNDTLIGLSPGADSLALVSTPYVVRLYPHAVFDRNTKLHLYFPGQGRFIYRSVTWLLVASLVFSLIVLLTFTLSILFMLNQKKISEMKTDFINNMTHEFKTPIATISLAADSIINEKVIREPERIGYYVDMIKKENTRMNRQVEDILTIARLDKRDFEFKWEAVDLHRLIEDVSESIRLQVDKRGGKLIMKLEAMNPIVTTDRAHCSNLIYNLLDNANKYSPDNPQLEIATRNTDKGVLVSVSDRGIGMSKAVQTKIFERFYRQTSGNIHNVKGFGLGLSYVRAIVEANKGSIQVRSEPGKGSCFEVFLPFVLDV
jgi:two-component system phosphate regulon sensor histidine kinase PhoR